jgi:hypothetical protein
MTQLGNHAARNGRGNTAGFTVHPGGSEPCPLYLSFLRGQPHRFGQRKRAASPRRQGSFPQSAEIDGATLIGGRDRPEKPVLHLHRLTWWYWPPRS